MIAIAEVKGVMASDKMHRPTYDPQSPHNGGFGREELSMALLSQA